MKTLFFFLSVTLGYGQNFAVKLNGTNDPSLPKDWPVIVTYIGTNKIAVADKVSVQMTKAEIDLCLATNKAEYVAKQAIVKQTEDQRLQALVDAADAEWNTLADWKTKLSKGEARVEDSLKIMENIIDVQLRIRGELRGMYKPQ